MLINHDVLIDLHNLSLCNYDKIYNNNDQLICFYCGQHMDISSDTKLSTTSDNTVMCPNCNIDSINTIEDYIRVFKKYNIPFNLDNIKSYTEAMQQKYF